MSTGGPEATLGVTHCFSPSTIATVIGDGAASRPWGQRAACIMRWSPIATEHRQDLRMVSWIHGISPKTCYKWKRALRRARCCLPESIETVTVVRGGLESGRPSQTFAGYTLFVTAGR